MPGMSAATRYGMRGGGWLPQGHDPTAPKPEPKPAGPERPYPWLPTTPEQWEGRARMAAARQAAGVPLDSVDVEALQRAGVPLAAPDSTIRPRQPVDTPHTATGATHPDTSYQAAARTRPRSGSDKAKVLGFIEQREMLGATDYEIEHVLNMAHQTASARRNDLMREGWIVDSGQRRQTGTGSPAIVWIGAR